MALERTSRYEKCTSGAPSWQKRNETFPQALEQTLSQVNATFLRRAAYASSDRNKLGNRALRSAESCRSPLNFEEISHGQKSHRHGKASRRPDRALAETLEGPIVPRTR